ncbi:DNA polymerase III, delta subunit [Desulfosporosinus orientis DSM 765]|uniref:DNA polymerase III subunit delta n=1 Tax=Desulfosporosinus orientis (strain ATCC 19365 / DSM 765 / NCIMB 8382 / VKM B-1628 / Singapore I) TaxID=768706 RepID=G7WJJ0_DESOD|nr:DNA polymerase III subunit delta [Desulfosporosinus orientis]AET70427.1 DNA polymerase III, delta subunit [Desulfosporosinus orientis DSM 765]
MREIERIKESIAKEKISPIYLWYGEDRFLIKEGLQVLKSFYLRTDPSGSGIEVIDPKEMTPAEIVERANTMSFFANRLVVVDEVSYFQDGQTLDLEPLLGYLSNPNPSTCLLLIAQSVHKGRKLYKAIDRLGEIIEFSSPKRPQEWISWVQSELKARGKSMDAQTTAQFIEWAGHQTGVLSQELDKLVVYVGNRAKITIEDVKLITPRTIEASIFDLLDAVAVRSAAKAIQTLREVLREEHPIKVLTLMVRQVRLLLGCDALRRRGGNVTEVSSALGIKPYEAQKIWQQSLKLSTQQLSKGLSECLNTDVALKSGGGDPGFLLEMMIVKFCEEEVS